MASSRVALLLCVLLPLFTSSSSFTLATSYEKVKLDLYYETLCPSCSIFMTKYLVKIFENGLIDIIDLHLVPYGNAKLVKHGDNTAIICQHDEPECKLNIAHACAIYARPDVNKHFEFLHCIEDLVVKNKYEMPEWESCFGKTVGIDRKIVMDCYHGPKGLELALKYANETNSLKPPHEYVPWVVVDGEPLREHFDEFMTYVCNAYKGSHLPKACENHLNRQVVSNVKENKVCNVASNTFSRAKMPQVSKWTHQMKMPTKH
ncbi:Gamma-interferon-inducible lysosomal thiol reductase [Thalictrum thalictroides]|uniref:Gamma-interferon-inducible lysosomal thiol reductase n=1 Tax=Thalictrum thalictroides TaxID=46969 RepID=A0A7J6WA35_THATH|nr:Gamma-interferon-inducible lysosomal thiol reductase [Thalictrum thalictroides]